MRFCRVKSASLAFMLLFATGACALAQEPAAAGDSTSAVDSVSAAIPSDTLIPPNVIETEMESETAPPTDTIITIFETDTIVPVDSAFVPADSGVAVDEDTTTAPAQEDVLTPPDSMPLSQEIEPEMPVDSAFVPADSGVAVDEDTTIAPAQEDVLAPPDSMPLSQETEPEIPDSLTTTIQPDTSAQVEEAVIPAEQDTAETAEEIPPPAEIDTIAAADTSKVDSLTQLTLEEGLQLEIQGMTQVLEKLREMKPDIDERADSLLLNRYTTLETRLTELIQQGEAIKLSPETWSELIASYKKKKSLLEKEIYNLTDSLATAYTDVLLTPEEILQLEAQSATLALEELRAIKPDIDKKGEIQYLLQYRELEKRLINVIRRAEIARFSPEAWLELRAQFEMEQTALLDEVDNLTDSLVAAYTDMLEGERGKHLLKKIEDKDKVYADYIYRLGVLNLEQAELKFEREMAQYDALLDTLPGDMETPPRPEKDYSLAVGKFLEIAQNYPQSDYVDDSHYNMAYIKINSENEYVQDEGYDLLFDFIERFSDSPYYPDVQFRLGEYFFNAPHRDLDSAIVHYKAVLQSPEDEQYPRALYRLGWVYYDADRFEDAVAFLGQTVDKYISELEHGRFSNLMEESIENLSKSFATDTVALGVASAVEFLNKDDRRRQFFGARMMKRIGDIYQGDFSYPQAISAYDTMLNLFPMDSEAHRFQNKKILIYNKLNDKDKVAEEKFQLFNNYNHTTPWAKSQKDKARLAEADSMAERKLRELVNENVKLSLESKSNEDYQKAVDLGKTYVDHYPETENSERIHYNLATLLWEGLGEYLPAYVEFIQMSRRYPKAEFRERAAENATETALILIKRQEEDSTFTLPPASELELSLPQEVIQKIPYLGENPLSTAEILYLKAAQNYVDLFPNGKKASYYLFYAGVLYDRHEKYAAARHYLEIMVDNFPNSERREEAVALILDGYFKAEDFTKSEEYARAILSGEVGGIFTHKLLDKAKARVRESIYFKAKALESSEDFLASGIEYKRAAMESQDTAFVATALWEAGRIFQKAAAWDSAIVTYQLLVQRVPKSQWADKSLHNTSIIYNTNLKEPRKAAETLELLFDSYPKSEYAQVALTNARFHYNENEDYESVIRVNEKYLSAFPQAEDAVQVLFENAVTYLKMGMLQRAVTSFTDFTKRFPDDPRNVEAEYQVGKYYLDTNDIPQARQHFERAVSLHRSLVQKGKLGYPKYAAFAKARMLWWKLEDYFKIQYAGVAAVDAARNRKNALKKELEEGYQELISFRQRESIQAIFNLCRIDEEIARAEKEQAIPSLASLELLGKKEEVLSKALPLYIDAANTYYHGYQELEQWRKDLTNQRPTLEAHIAALDSLVTSETGIPPDSQIVLEAQKKVLKDVDESIALSELLQDSCMSRYSEIYLKNPTYLVELVDGLLAIPDAGNRTDRTISRNITLSRTKFYALNTVFLYRDAYVAIDTVKQADQLRKETAMKGAEDIFSAMFAEYDTLFSKVDYYFDINIRAFHRMVDEDDDAAENLYNPILNYFDLGKEILDSMLVMHELYLTQVHKDTVRVPYTDFLDSLYASAAWRYYSYYNDKAQQCSLQYEIYDEKAIEGSYLHETGALLFDEARGYAEDYREDYRDISFEYICDYDIASQDADRYIRTMVKLDPFQYGDLMDLTLSSEKIYGDSTWKVTDQAPSDFIQPDFEDSDWAYAVFISPYPEPEPEVDSLALDSLGMPLDSTMMEETQAEVDTAQAAEDTTGAIVDSMAVMTDSTMMDSTMMDSVMLTEGELMETDSLAADSLSEMAETELDSALADTLPEIVEADTLEETIPEVVLDLSALEEIVPLPIWAENPAEKLHFRFKFNIEGKPISGLVYLSADEKFALWVNSQFVAEYGSSEDDSWILPYNTSVKSFLLPGLNTIAVEAIDSDLTTRGLWFKLEFSVMPENIDEIPVKHASRQIAPETESEPTGKTEAVDTESPDEEQQPAESTEETEVEEQ